MFNHIAIKNELFGSYTSVQSSKIYQIKPMGFYILTYLIYGAKGTSYIDTNIGIIMHFLKIDKKTVNKYLSLLQQNKLITCKDNLLIQNKNTPIRVCVDLYNELSGGYELMPVKIFEDYCTSIRDIGWILLCLITKMVSFKLGDISSGGYANCSEYVFANYLGVHCNTISKYVKILESQKLIKVIPGENIVTGYDEYGNEEKVYTPNIYKVPFKYRAS
jgi:Mn-dependent DtxR family transcriptional regulator